MGKIIRKWLPWFLVLLLFFTAIPQQAEAAVRISKTSVSVNVNRTVMLKVTGTKAKVTWTSSNKKIATVNSKGVVKGVKKGTATIKAKVSNKTLKCKVTVKKPAAAKKSKSSSKGSKISKEQYANFRNVHTGRIAPKVLYRCMNPLIPNSSKWNTAANYADKLLETHHINTVINLCDTMTEMKTKGRKQAVYYNKLLMQGKVYSRLLKDNGNYTSAARKKEIAGLLRLIIQNEGPYLIHCRWGQGRTGMVIMLLECLMGADYNYIYSDFTMTFKNFDKVGKHTSTSDYNKEFTRYMKSITGKNASNPKKPKAKDWKKVNLVKSAENYLKAGGMTAAEITCLKSRLSGH